MFGALRHSVHVITRVSFLGATAVTRLYTHAFEKAAARSDEYTPRKMATEWDK